MKSEHSYLFRRRASRPGAWSGGNMLGNGDAVLAEICTGPLLIGWIEKIIRVAGRVPRPGQCSIAAIVDCRESGKPTPDRILAPSVELAIFADDDRDRAADTGERLCIITHNIGERGLVGSFIGAIARNPIIVMSIPDYIRHSGDICRV